MGDESREGRNERFFESIVENIPAMVFVKEAEELRFVRFNRAGEAILGLDRADILGRNDHDFFPREQADFFVAKDREVLQSGEAVDVGEEPIDTAHGRRWLHTRKIPLLDDEGEAIYLLGVSVDVTREHEAKEALEAQQAKLQALVTEVNSAREALARRQRQLEVLLGQFPGLLFTADGAQRVIEVSGQRAETFGDVGPGAGVAEWLGPEGAAAVAEALGGGTGAAELRRDHRIFELRVESAGDGVVGAALEVTERRKLADEELQARLQRAQKLELLGLLAGGIAHDFNNLLAGMLGHASLARMQLPPDHEAQPSLERVEACADRASDLTRQMLAYSGRGRFVVQPVDLSDAVQDMTGLMRVTQGKDVELDIQLDAALPPVEADVAQLRQLVMNLITNAADAIGDKPGRIRIRTSLLYCDPEFLERAYLREPLAVGTYVCLEVTDSGCGMDPSVVERMFDPFFTTKETGHGLGLAATLGIVRGHGGAIVVDSVPGQGTTIRVLLPPTDGKPVTTGRLLTLEDDLPRGAGTVLIVDDEDSVRTLAAAALRRAGWRTLQARDGLEALEKVGRHREKIRLVLLDMTMPRMDGPETWARLRDLAPGLPVLMSSGYAENEVRGRFEAGGPAGFLQKPYRAQELINAVADVLESRSAARE